jgi:DnaK suppressor protein
MLEIILNFLFDYRFFISIAFAFYFIFKFLNFYGLRKEKSFDLAVTYIISLLFFLKAFYFFENYQNYSSISEILLSLNFSNYSFYLILSFNIVFSFIVSRFVNFSKFKISDSLSFVFGFYLILSSIKTEQIWLILLIFVLNLYFNKKFVSGFVTFFFNFSITNYFLIYPRIENNFIFYIIVNILTAFLIIRRVKYMNQLSPEFIDNCKQNLMSRKHKLLEELKMIDESVDPDRDVGNAEYLDEVAEDMQVERNYILKKDIESSIEKINRALKRIEEGKYGIDQKTGEPIEKARLEMFPESEHNVE